MDTGILLDGFIQFLGFIAFVAFHEFAHAWVATRCGDDTPRLQGRVTLDPIAHIDWFGTVLLPLILVFMGAASGRLMLFGWGKPVQVNLNNLKHRRRDDILISAAGPVMNLLLAVVLLAMMKIGSLTGHRIFTSDSFLDLTRLTLFLFFFNLLPVPPLDGAHVLRNLIGMSDEVYQQISRYSFLLFIVVMRSDTISALLSGFTHSALSVLVRLFGWELVPR